MGVDIVIVAVVDAVVVIIKVYDTLLWGFSSATELLDCSYSVLQSLYCASNM